MTNKRLLEFAERVKNDSLPTEREKPKPQPIQTPATNIPTSVDNSFILQYDDFGKEVIAKSNELFAGTKVEIPMKNSGEVTNMYILKRLAITTAIAKNQNLRNRGVWPITLGQSEDLLKCGNLPDPSKYWEDLGLVLYDISQQGCNPQEARVLNEGLIQHRSDLGLNNNDLESALLVFNTCLEKDPNMPHGVKPIVLPGVTRAYTHEVLSKTGQNYNFEYGLERGLPKISDLGKGDRTLYMPSETTDIGLRVLFRYWDLDLGAGGTGLAGSSESGRVNMAPQGWASSK